MRYESNGVADTYALAQKIAEKLVGGEVILLNGELGAGKTTFTKGLAEALGVTRTVVSPTFTIVREYEGRLKLNHVDMYRLSSEDEALEAGIGEVFEEDAVVVIEWNKFQKIEGKTITIDITPIGENQRIMEVSGLEENL